MVRGAAGDRLGRARTPRPRARVGVRVPRARPSSTRSSKTRWSRAEARRPASRTRSCSDSRAASAVWRRWRARSAPHPPRVRRSRGGPRRSPSAAGPRQRLGGHPSGQQAGGDGVVDALAGQRVDQPGGVAGQQDAPAARAQRTPRSTAAGGGRASRRRPVVAPGRRWSSCSSSWRPGRGCAAGGQQLAVPDVAGAVAAVEGPGVGRLPGVAEGDGLGAGPARAGWARSRGSPAPGARPAEPTARAAPPSGRRRLRRPRVRRPRRRA